MGDKSTKDFPHLLSEPQETLLSLLLSDQNGSGKEIQSKLRYSCQHLFKEVEELSKAYRSLRRDGEDNASPESLSGLDQLYIGSDEHPADAETLWGQVEIQNTALQPLLKKSLKRVIKSVNGGIQNEVRLLDLEGVSDSEEKEKDMGASSDESSSVEEDEEADEETMRIRQRMQRAMADMEEESTSDMDLVQEEETTNDETDEESIVDPAAEELNNGFFDMHEMEDFADEEEAYLPDEAFGTPRPEDGQPREIKSFHQRQREGDIGSDAESDEEEAAIFGEAKGEPHIHRRKYREDDEVAELYKLYQNPESDDEDSVVNMTAADFFGMPNKKYFHKWKADNEHSSKTDDASDAESWDDHDFESNASGWRDTQVAVDEDERSGDGDESEAGDDRATAENSDDRVLGENLVEESSEPLHTKKSDKLRQQTEQLEKEMLAEKPWQMTGETKSMSRPVNSLLEATPEFEVATKMAPLITIEHTENLEDVIRRRILNEDWDDIIPRELPDIGWNKKRSEAPEVSQEKSKLGLGELYEREYLKKAVGYDVDAAEKQTEEDKAKNEMKALFANLCSKLDALSNYHFAPRPISDEAEVRPVTTPAIAMEEVMPLHVSDARGVAPEEVYEKKRGRDGVLRGETEMDQTDRKRLRGAKKTARRKKKKQKLVDEKLISRLDPGLGLNNPYEKRKMREELSVARAQGKVTAGDVDINADYGASGKLFKRMQEQVEQSIKGDDDHTKTTKTKRQGQTSSSFKL